MAISDDALTRLPAQALETISRRIHDGDILLCSARDPFSRLIAWSTKSPWSHVALAYRWPQAGTILAFECVQHIGVRAVSLDRFISQTSSGTHPYPGKIVLARHADLAARKDRGRGDRVRAVAERAVDTIGDRFSNVEVIKIALRITVGRLNRHMPKLLEPDDEFICSEYVARCFAAAGIEIRWDGLGFIAPADFALDPKVRAVARFKTR